MERRGEPTSPRLVVVVEPELLAASRSRHPSSHVDPASRGPETDALATARDRAASEVMNQEVPAIISESGPTSSAIGNRAALGSIEPAYDLVRPPERVAGLLGPVQGD